VPPAVALATDDLVTGDGAGSTLRGLTAAGLLLDDLLLLLLLRLRTRRDVIIVGVVLKAPPHAVDDILLGTTYAKFVLLAECIENFLGAVPEIIPLLSTSRVIQFDVLLLLDHLHVLRVIVENTDSTLHQGVQILDSDVDLVVRDELLEEKSHGRHFATGSWKVKESL